MRFRPGAKLDPSQVTDVRGRRMGGPVLAGGGGVGVIGLIVFVLYVVLMGYAAWTTRKASEAGPRLLTAG